MSKIKFVAIFLLEAIIKIITQILRHTSGTHLTLNSQLSMMYISMSITLLVYIKDIVINVIKHKYLPYL